VAVVAAALAAFAARFSSVQLPKLRREPRQLGLGRLSGLQAVEPSVGLRCARGSIDLPELLLHLGPRVGGLGAGLRRSRRGGFGGDGHLRDRALGDHPLGAGRLFGGGLLRAGGRLSRDLRRGAASVRRWSVPGDPAALLGALDGDLNLLDGLLYVGDLGLGALLTATASAVAAWTASTDAAACWLSWS
jgi:hypothetical protein